MPVRLPAGRGHRRHGEKLLDAFVLLPYFVIPVGLSTQLLPFTSLAGKTARIIVFVGELVCKFTMPGHESYNAARQGLQFPGSFSEWPKSCKISYVQKVPEGVKSVFGL